MRPLLLTLLACLWACDPAPAPTPSVGATTSTAAAATTTSSSAAPADPAALRAQAEALARRVIIVDGHVDLPHRLQEQKKAKGKIVDDVAGPCPEGNFDYPRAKQGGLDAPFMSIYVPAEYQDKGGAKAYADGLIDIVEGICQAAPDKFAVAKSPADVEAHFKAGKIALPMGIENGAAIEGKLENLKHFYDRGVRYITLTHSEDNDICDSSYATTHKNGGLSAFGEEVVAEMNRLGIMVDVSHISDDAFWEVIKVTKAPVIASHSSLRHFTPGFERNMNDEMVKAVAENGGVVMINYGSSFVNEAARVKRTAAWEAREAFMEKEKIEAGDPRLDAWRKDYEKNNPLPFATVEQVADHIVRVIALAGIDHVGLGSDFDGVGDSLPEGLKDASQLPNLFAVLLARGLDEAAIEKIASGNVLRVWRKVEAIAAAK